VYQNSREGFRFLVPEGWKIQAKSEVPAGKADKERMLVQYTYAPDRQTAVEFEITLADLPPSTNLAAYLAEPTYGSRDWRQVGRVESLSIGGKDAERYVFTGHAGRRTMTKEVTVFRRENRSYFFTGLYASSDKRARSLLHNAVESVKWKK
jgi:hypothetical protein